MNVSNAEIYRVIRGATQLGVSACERAVPLVRSALSLAESDVMRSLTPKQVELVFLAATAIALSLVAENAKGEGESGEAQPAGDEFEPVTKYLTREFWAAVRD
jgi:hypothetical protein